MSERKKRTGVSDAGAPFDKLIEQIEQLVLGLAISTLIISYLYVGATQCGAHGTHNCDKLHKSSLSVSVWLGQGLG